VSVYLQLANAMEFDESERLQKFCEVTHTLPPPNLFLLQHFVAFLRIISLYSDYSKMTPSNLAIVFAPNLMQTSDNLDCTVNLVMEEMITKYDEIFRPIEKMRLKLKKERFEELKKEKTASNEKSYFEEVTPDEPSKTSASSFSSGIQKQGYLTKKGDVRRNWSTRWFVLKYNWLGYYKGPEVCVLCVVFCYIVCCLYLFVCKK
jgi:hypothetical protein